MRTKLFFISGAVLLFLIAACGRGADPKAEITIVDEKDRPIKNATVEIYSRPTNLIQEDAKITNEDGKTFHEFVFEGTLDVYAYINVWYNYQNLSGTGEIILSRDEIYRTTITLHKPVIVEE